MVDLHRKKIRKENLGSYAFLVPWLLGFLGLTLYPMLYSLYTLILLAVWQFCSPMIIFLAGLQQIPREYYEASSVDGAGRVLRHLKRTQYRIFEKRGDFDFPIAAGIGSMALFQTFWNKAQTRTGGFEPQGCK